MHFEDSERRLCGVMRCQKYGKYRWQLAVGEAATANSLIRDVQISKAYSVKPWSHDEAVNTRRVLGAQILGDLGAKM